MVADEHELAALCARLVRGHGARTLRATIASGADPLGEAFCELRSAETRRERGATYTPSALVDAMVGWAKSRCSTPVRVVDPGCGSARFLRAAGRAFPQATLVGVEFDPLAAACARASLAVDRMAKRAQILELDYRDLELPAVDGATLFLGNPPYVRHHGISPQWKDWLRSEARAQGLPVSALAGLHVHFFLATARLAREGDLGCLVTAAEWLDVNYGALPRALLCGDLGLERLIALAPEAMPFADAQTTAAISCFAVGSTRRSVRFESVRNLRELARGSRARSVSRKELAAAPRWSQFLSARRLQPRGTAVGELFRVHRGQVTGANRVWIAAAETPSVPARFLQPCITRARELIEAAGELRSCEGLRQVIELPAELGVDSEQLQPFLDWARAQEAHLGYVARHRKPWWSVRLRAPAPILMTYMARRAPVFVLNTAGARHINVAHGLYPRGEMSFEQLRDMVARLNRGIDRASGRTYAGGLTKFEPREVERVILAA